MKAVRDPFSKLHGYYQRKVGSLVFRRPFTVELRQSIVSFTFDDFPRSALFNGGAILKKLGIAGTYYAAFGLVNQDTPTGRIFSPEDLPLLFDQGHELGCHTFSHCDSWETDSSVFEQSVVKNRAALHKYYPGAEFQSFAYPISMPRPFSKARIARYFQSCRGGGQSLNAGKIDLNQLSAFFLEKSRDDIQTVKDLIDRNKQEGGWLVLATHDVTETPTPFGCTPEFFEEVVQYSLHSGSQILTVAKALDVLGAAVPSREIPTSKPAPPTAAAIATTSGAAPLVSILIPAYNAQEWISDTLRSAIAQTWTRKEIIVVDDGSSDQTMRVAQQFEADGVRVVTQKNQGAAAARNHALKLAQGDYIQWLDADDLLAPDKIARQLAVLNPSVGSKVLLSSEFGRFLYQWKHARFVQSELWEDVSPTEWLLRKMGQNLYMQTATWLVSRELSEASGLWDTRMLSDDDGEYFCRVLLNSEGVRFVPDSKVYYRGYAFDSLAYVGKSNRKREALWLSMKLHIGYLRSLEDSPRTREACLNYLQRNLIHFYPDMPEIVKEAELVAQDLGGEVGPPHLPWKYSWIKSAFGWKAAKNTALRLRKLRWSSQKSLDKAIFKVKNWNGQLAIPDIDFTPTREVAPK